MFFDVQLGNGMKLVDNWKYLNFSRDICFVTEPTYGWMSASVKG